MPKHILIVDDDALMRRSTAFNLEKSGYQVSTAASAEDALDFVRSAQPTRLPDLVLLDIGLPGIDGLEALRRLRQTHDVPVIFVTARRRELDEVLGLELGADDYVPKPFDLDVLLAHIRAVLRRSERRTSGASEPNVLTAGNLVIDPGAHTVMLAGAPVDLSPREFDLLYALASQPGKVMPVDDLLARVWGAEFAGQPQVVYVHIRWLREKIEADPNRPRRLRTVRGVGYKLEAVEA